MHIFLCAFFMQHKNTNSFSLIAFVLEYVGYWNLVYSQLLLAAWRGVVDVLYDRHMLSTETVKIGVKNQVHLNRSFHEIVIYLVANNYVMVLKQSNYQTHTRILHKKDFIKVFARDLPNKSFI